ncbi:DNA topoisomerase 2-alpha-like, partial [Homalodisca vitripennis]|uniref:DNA topoisomerase 2-alpha-like n=1 Tax=Homalodisca vitripennis TaxID=197043 RepID=UPI001EEB4D52
MSSLSLLDYKEYHTDTTVRFVVTLSADKTTEVGRGRSPQSFQAAVQYEHLLHEFYEVRLEYYEKRKAYLEGMLQAEAAKLSNQARFIVEKCDGILTIENKKKKAMIEELVKKGYDSDPVKAWKLKQDREAVL